MNTRLAALVGCLAVLAVIVVYTRLSGIWHVHRSSIDFSNLKLVGQNTIFASLQEQNDANRIYRELQNYEFQALNNALDDKDWQEAIAVEFDVSDEPALAMTNRHRLIWDVFG